MIPIIGDTHFGSKNFNKSVFNNSMKFFEDQFFPFCLKNNVKDVIHLGDLVHNRNVIDLWLLQELKTRFFHFFEKNKITLHCNIGNHDIYYKNTIQYSFQKENLNEFEFCKVYHSPEVVKIEKFLIGMTPWQIENCVPDFQCDILCGHFEIQNFLMEKNYFSKTGINESEFSKFSMVFSGHYHIKSRRNNIIFCGNPFQQTWNDYDIDKGFYILNDDFTFKFIKNTVSPIFVKIVYTETKDGIVLHIKNKEVSQEKLFDIVQKNYCRLLINKSYNSTKLEQFYKTLCEMSKDNHKIDIINVNEVIEDFDFTKLEDEILFDSDLSTMIKTYIDNSVFIEGIDKDFFTTIISDFSKRLKSNQ